MAAQVDAKPVAQIQILIKLLKEYEWITNSYMVDFFVLKLLDNLPSSWRKLIQETKLEYLGEFIDFTSDLRGELKTWPLSLLSLRSFLRAACMTRKCTPLKTEDVTRTKWFHLLKTKNLLLKHVKPKKRYEIEKMAATIASMAQKENVNCVIDIGSGLGHLCRALSYGHGLKTLAIETQKDLITRAQDFDAELEVVAGKNLDQETMNDLILSRPFYKHAFIESATACEDIATLMKEVEDRHNKTFKFGIVGLHPCGDLAVTLLRLFLQTPSIRFINIVGCCYHKMTLRGEQNLGFPLSKEVLYKISTETAALGCHALEAYSERLRKGEYDNLKIHCYRAALEQIINKNWPQHRRSGLNNVRHYPDLSFAQYCEKAVKKLGLVVPEEDLTSEETLTNLNQWKEAVFYHSLMVFLGPAIESLILLDRQQFLLENGLSCQLYAIFDPSVSARNFILQAVKPTPHPN